VPAGNLKNHQSPDNHQSDDKNEELIAAAKQLLVAAGYNSDAIIDGLQVASQQSPNKNDSEDGYKFYKEKCLVYEDRDAFIYLRPDRKSAIWYFRLYDYKTNKPLVKSLKTTDKTQALVSARALYIDIKGKIERGERLKSITTPELVKEWLEKLSATVTEIPHQGIVPKSYKQKRSFLRRWLLYIDELGYTNTTIDKIKPVATRDFASWLKVLPKETCQHTGARSVEQINNNVSAVIRMYHQYAVREKYISVNNVPQIDRLKYKINDQFKRDIFELSEYDQYIWYLKRNYCTKKHNPDIPPEELEKRKIFTEFLLLLSNAGFRPKELLGIKFREIYASPTWTKEQKEENIVMLVRRTNSKTGKERRVVAPVKKRIDRIIAAYKKLGIKHEPDDYLFINAAYGRRTALGRMIMYQRLKKTLVTSQVQETLDKQSKSISLYSFRHFYCYLRLLNKVPIHLLAKNMGTSVQKIESTYGHINTELQADVITKGQGIFKRTETTLETLPTIEGDS
jgi:site-specific recombinase XerD